jgi:Meiotically up-regulated gene 113
MMWVVLPTFFMPQTDSSGYVYCIYNRDMGVCKIGYSIDPMKRLKEIQTGFPYPLKLVWMQEGDTNYERELHNRFEHYRTYGEWFKIAVLYKLIGSANETKRVSQQTEETKPLKMHNGASQPIHLEDDDIKKKVCTRLNICVKAYKGEWFNVRDIVKRAFCKQEERQIARAVLELAAKKGMLLKRTITNPNKQISIQYKVNKK